jgi:starch-binding outer membrane protein, SusD/RagB family
MKFVKTLSAIILLFFALVNCNDDFLIKNPPGIPASNYFHDEKGINVLLTGAYSMIRGSAFWDVTWGASIQNWTFGSVASGCLYRGRKYRVCAFARYGTLGRKTRK